MIQFFLIVTSVLAVISAILWYDKSKRHHNSVGMATVAISCGSVLGSMIATVMGAALLLVAFGLWVFAECHGFKIKS